MDESTDERSAPADEPLTGVIALAYRALLDHVSTCEQCVDDSRECPTGRALIRTLREARQSAC